MNRIVPLSALWLALAAAAPPPAKPPLAAVEPVVDTIQGVKVADPYRWLEAGGDPRVKAWVAGQNAVSRPYLDGIPARKPLYDMLMGVAKATPTYDAGLVQAGGSLFAYTVSPAAQQPVLNRLAIVGDQVTRTTIVNPNTMSAKGGVAIDWFEPSPDGKLVAVSLSEGGSEDGTLHIYEVATGKEVEAPIAHVQYPTAGGSLAWARDGKSYWYTRFPREGSAEETHFNQTAWYHVVGQPETSDVQVLSARDGLPRTAEVFLSTPPAGNSALASIQLGDGGEWQHYLLTSTGARKVAAYDDKIAAAVLAPDGSLFGISHKGALNGTIVKLAPGAGPGQWRTIVPEGQVSLVSADNDKALVISGDRLFATSIDGGPTKLLAFDLDGKPLAMDTPPVSSIDQLEADGKGGLYYRLRTYIVNTTIMHWTPDAGRATAMLTRKSPLDFTDIAVERVFVTSKDGTKVPVTLLHRRDRKADGKGPALLYGYGGYGVNQTPGFLGALQRAWFDAGGVWAIANIRGGGEYGERWHLGGNLLNKQNVFDDFAAAGEWMKTSHWAAPDRLALLGGSNGGLLMGAVLTQHPALARAVVSQVGIYDMLRVELDPNGSFNVTEFGTVTKPDQFKALYAYSPYHHVVKGALYPALLLTTGDNDGRVNPLHSRKFAAAMQAATGSDRPVLLRTSANAGHGIGSSLDEAVSLQADVGAFLFDQLGMGFVPTAAK
jgi:prolyl oligopeptidase